jgi:rhodanese-related sulfurtransferase
VHAQPVVSPAVPSAERSSEPAPEVEVEVEVEVDTAQLRVWRSDKQGLVLVDIREPHELQHGVAEGALLLRMNDIPERLHELPAKSTRLVIYCAAGVRSYGVTHWLREQGWTDTWSLTSGFAGAVDAGFSIVHRG